MTHIFSPLVVIFSPLVYGTRILSFVGRILSFGVWHTYGAHFLLGWLVVLPRPPRTGSLANRRECVCVCDRERARATDIESEWERERKREREREIEIQRGDRVTMTTKH